MAIIRGTNGSDNLVGTDEDDLIFGRRGDDTISGGSGDDFILTGRGNNIVDGGDGNDVIIGDRGDDMIDGGDGDDVILSGRGDDDVTGGAGNDFIQADRGDDTVRGGAGNDTILGDRGNDDLYGGAGDDTLVGGRGNDFMDGEDGSDTYQVGGRRDGFDEISDSGTGDGDYDVIEATSNNTRIQMRDFDSSNGIEEISGNGFANVDIRGDNSDNTFDFSGTTLSGIREIDMRGGDDSVIASAGDDNIDGGSGFDTVFYSGSIDDYDMQQSGSTMTVTDNVNGNGQDTLQRVEMLQFDDYTYYMDGRNNGPVAVDDEAKTDEDYSVNISIADLIANDKDYDGDTLSFDSIDTTGTLGSVTVNSDGTLSYDPNGAFESLAVGETAVDTFTYTVSDGNGGFATGTVSVNVTGVNDGPSAADDTAGVNENEVLSVANDGVLSNDSDPDASDTLSVGAVEGDAANVGQTITLASGALLTMNADGSYSYDPNGKFNWLSSGQTATDTFTYTVTDGHDGAGTPASTEQTLLNESFDGGVSGFTYADDTFRGTGEPAYADGAWGAGFGDGSGGLQVTLGGQDNADILGMSGGWTTTIEVPEDASGTLTFKYNLSLAENYEADEFAQVMLSVDGNPIGANGADFIAQLTGDGNGGPVMSTGWQTVSIDLGTLTAGSHTITIGGYSNKKTYNDESAEILIDHVSLTTDTTPMIETTLMSESFDGGEGGFGYVEDAFRGTGEPDYADGAWGAGLGETGGGLQITLGGQDGADIFGMSAGWQTTVDVPEDASGTLTFKYNMTLAPNFESDEFGQVMVSIDGTLYGAGGNDYVAQLNGDGNGGSPTSTGWQTFTVNLADLPAGPHTITIGGYSNKKTFADESVEILIDDVQFTTSVPDPDATGPDTATVSVTITGVEDNHAPVAYDDELMAEEGVMVEVNGVLDNDVDPDAGDTLTVSAVNGTPVDSATGTEFTLASGAILFMRPDGTYSYDPNGAFNSLGAGESGTDSFSYTAMDSAGATNTATVTVTIMGANDAPVAGDDALSVGEDDGATVGTNLLSNDSDPDASDTLSVTQIGTTVVDPVSGATVTLGNGAELVVSADGSYSFNPNGGYESLAAGATATETFTYTVEDGNGGSSTATLTVTITGVNDGPVAVNDSLTVSEDDFAVSSTASVLANDSDADGDALTVTEYAGVAPGTPTFLTSSGAFVSMNDQGEFSYAPVDLMPGPTFGQQLFDYLGEGETATDSFTYTVTDTSGATSTATVTVTITGVNDAPVAVNDSLTVSEDDFAVSSLASVLANDGDVDGDALTVTEFAGVTPGTPTFLTPSGAFVTMTDQGDFSYSPVNLMPGPMFGQSLFNHLAVGETATDSFTYTVSDGNGGTDTATVTVTITGVNDGPVAEDDALTVAEDAGATSGTNLLSNDSDIDLSDTLSVTAIGGQAVDQTPGATTTVNLVSGAVLTIAADGTYSYDPNGAFESLEDGQTATETITYTVSDGNGGTDTATVVVTIEGISNNQAPIAADDALSVGEDDGAATAGNLLSNDSDVDGGTLSVTQIGTTAVDPVSGATVTLTNGAELVVSADGSYSFNPNGGYESLAAGATATETFTYTVEDGQGGSSTATLTVTVTGTNDGPVASADTVGVGEDGVAVAATTGNLLGNDSDVDAGDVLSVTSVQTEAGTVTAIDPAAGAVGITLAMGGVLTIAADGSYSYSPNGEFDSLAAGQTATETVTYTVSDGNGGTDTAVVTFTVTGANDGPVASADMVGVGEDDVTAATGNLLGNDSDVDAGDVLSVTSVRTEAGTVTAIDPGAGGVGITLAMGGVLTIAADGSYSYSPNGEFDSLAAGQTATETVTYTVSDGNGGTDTAVVTFTVTGANDGPVAAADTVGVGEDDVTAATGNLLGNDSDVDAGDVLSVTSVQTEAGTVTAIDPAAGGVGITLAMGGVLTIAADGSYSYSPNGEFDSLAPGQTATETVTYTVSDGNGGTDTAVVTFTVTGTNSSPVASADGLAAVEDVGLTFNASDLLGNDSDVDGGTLSVAAIEGQAPVVGTPIAVAGSAATVTLNADGTYTYDQNGAFDSLAVGATATDTFTYTVSDGQGGTDTATVTVTITGTNDGPVAAADTVGVGEDDVTAATGNLLGNDSDVDAGDVLSVTSVRTEAGTVTAIDPGAGGVGITLAMGGVLTIAADGSYSYSPNGEFDSLAAGQTATETVTYTVSDGNGGTDTAVVTFTVTGANDGPVASADMVGVGEDDVTAATGNLLGNDSDVDAGDVLSVTSVQTEAGTVTAIGPGAGGVGITLAMGGVLTIAADGSYSFAPNGEFDSLAAGQTATETVTYTVSDGNGGTDTAVVTFTVTGTNDGPVAAADTVGVGEDDVTAATGNLLGNDSDVDVGDVLTVTSVQTEAGTVTAIDPAAGGVGITLAMGGVLTIAADGSYSYSPNGEFDSLAAGQTATETVTYTVSDGNGGTDTAVVTFTVTGANDGPVASADMVGVGEDDVTAATGNLLGNDSDVDAGDVLSVTSVQTEAGTVTAIDPAAGGVGITLAMGGVLTIAADGSYSYSPNGEFDSLAAGQTATETVTYTVSDGNGGTDTAVVTFTVTGANDGPVASADMVGVGEDDVTAAIGNLLGNDSDVDVGDVLSVTSVQTEAGTVTAIDPAAGAVGITLAMGGVLTIAADGSYSFSPNGEFDSLAAGQTATETVTYTVSDGNGGTDTAVVTFTVTGTNDGPVASADGLAAVEDVGLTFNASDLLGNDSDVDGGTLSLAAIEGQAPVVGTPIAVAGSAATVTLNADGTYTYDQNGAFDGLAVGATATDTFTYTVSDGQGGTDTATVTVTITGTNDGPVAAADTVGVGEDDVAAATGNLLGNDSDVDAGDVLSVTSVQTEAGTVTAIGPGAGGVGITLAMGGVLTIAADGSYSFAPNGEFDSLAAGQTATETVTYTVSDGNGGTDTAVVTFTVTGTNDGPVAAADGLAAVEDVGLTFNASDLLGNDSDVDGGTLGVAAIEGQAPVVGTPIAVAGSAATVTLNADGTYTYDQNGAFDSLAVGATATDTFTYTVSDGQGGTDTATVTVTITGTNDGPVAAADTVGVGEDDVAAATGNLLGNDSDVDVGDVLSVTSVQTEAGTVTAIGPGAGGVGITLAMGGVLTIAADGSYSYSPNGEFDSLAAGQTATETVTYTVSDGNGGTDTAVVTFTVTGTNDGPVAVADAGTTDENTVLSVPANGVLSNDSDPDAGDTFTVTAVQGVMSSVGSQITLASGALLTMNADGSYAYDPNGQFSALLDGQSATDTFTYTITDSQGATDTATVTVTINGISNTAPVANNDTATTTEDDVLTVPANGVLANDTDPDAADVLSVSAVEGSGSNVGTQITLASGALLTMNANGSYTYDPNGAFDSLAVGQTGTDTFTYTVDDGNGATDTATVTVSLTGVNDAPVAVSDTFVVAHDNDTEVETPTYLDNDFDPEGSALTLVSLDGTPVDFSAGPMDVFLANGDIVQFNPDYTFYYVLNDPAAGDLLFGESFTTGPVQYVIEDADGAQTTGSITFVVSNSTFNIQDLDGTNGFVVNGVGATDLAGHSVSGVGDVNGDGYEDFIVGAFQANPATGTDAGASYVVFGDANGPGASLNLSSLDGTNGFAINGTVAGQFTGRSVSGAGDVNGDGFADIIVGMRDESSAGAPGSESAYVIYGSASGFGASIDVGSLNGANGFSITGIDTNFSDIVVGSAGDVNGDGIDDIVVGSQGAGTSNVGASYVVFGQSGGFGSSIDVSTLDGTNGFSITGSGTNLNLGFAVSGGDLNNDGYDDVIVSAIGSDPSAVNNAGEVYVVYGGATGIPASVDVSTLNGTNGFSITGANIDGEAGNSISSAGDINGDGIDDLVIGERGYYYGTGGAYVVFGQDGGHGTGVDLASLDGTNGFRIVGNEQGDEAGYSVSMAGDINGDGFDDIIIGARGAMGYDYYGGQYSNFGESYVVFGSAGGFGATINLNQLDGSNGFTISGVVEEDTLGNSVSAAGDINGDGYDDLIIGAPKTDANGNDSGAAYVLYGQDFQGSVTHQGTAAADNLTGDATANTMIGGTGDDILTGAGGLDVLYGGEGDDTLVIADLAPQRIDGGTGEDTLQIEGASLNIDLGDLPISGIEAVDITGAGDNVLTLNVMDVLDASDSSNTLKVLGDLGDQVVAEGGWTSAGQQLDGGVLFDVYTAGEATLMVDSDINNNVVIV